MNVAEPFDREFALGSMIGASPDADDGLAEAERQSLQPGELLLPLTGRKVVGRYPSLAGCSQGRRR